jgi:predicted RNase H-like HicB family nuclease
LPGQCVLIHLTASAHVCTNTHHEIGRYHYGFEVRRLERGCPEGKPRSVQTSDEAGPCNRPSPKEGYPDRNASEYRKAGIVKAEVTTQYQIENRAIGARPQLGEFKMRHYIALIHKDADSDYGVSFPDLPGVITAGSTVDEAREMAAEALALHIEGVAEDGDVLPEPSSLEDIMAHKENKDAVAVLIPAPAANAVKSVRVNVTLPSDVLEQIDARAESEGFTRSGFLAQAARKAMAA